MLAELVISDNTTIAFFTGVVGGIASAIVALWIQVIKCNSERTKLWAAIAELKAAVGINTQKRLDGDVETLP